MAIDSKTQNPENTSCSPAETSACLLAHSSPNYSKQGKSFAHLYEQDVVIKRCSDEPCKQIGGGKRGKVFEFSQASKRNLLKVCRNSGHHIKSQICLTYHECSPISGKQVKRNLDNFLKYLRRENKNLHYIWVLEFQKNGHPHVHLFTDIEPTPTNRERLAHLWNTTTGESESNKAFTSHPRNFFPWRMSTGTYLSKEYLAKSIQKDVPKTFQDVGRFWGNSKNMIPRFVVIEPGKNIPERIYKKVVRCVSKQHEKHIELQKTRLREKGVKIKKRKKNTRNRHITTSLPACAMSFITLAQTLLHESQTGFTTITYATSLARIFEGIPF